MRRGVEADLDRTLCPLPVPARAPPVIVTPLADRPMCQGFRATIFPCAATPTIATRKPHYRR
jgi:hypothetical protein